MMVDFSCLPAAEDDPEAVVPSPIGHIMQRREFVTTAVIGAASLGAGAFTPIVNWPEVAILGVAPPRMVPGFTPGEFVARFRMPLTRYEDPRGIDRAPRARSLSWIVAAIEQPALMWMDV